MALKKKKQELKQRAKKFLNNGDFVSFFEFLEKEGCFENSDDIYQLNHLKNTFLIEGVRTHSMQRLLVFAYKILDKEPLAINRHFITSILPTTQFIGRKSEIENLHQHLQAKKPTVLVNGIGGIGKTALAKKYVEDYHEKYDHIVWLNQQTSLLSAFITNRDLTGNMGFTNETELERFERILNELQSKQGKNLLIVDNYQKNDLDRQFKLITYFYDLRFKEWSILFTSREVITYFETFTLGLLSEEEAIKLFLLHCKNRKVDKRELQKLLKLIDYHTLTIELLAKNYSESWDLDNVQQITEILEKKALNDDQLQKLIEIGLEEQEIKLYSHLVNIFNIQPLSAKEKHLFKQFAVLPHEAINGKKLLEWLNDKKKVYEPILKQLAKKGWLTSHDKLHFEMHRLISMLMLKKLNPSFKENSGVLNGVLNELDGDKIELNPLKFQYLTNYGDALLININFQQNILDKSVLQSCLANLYKYTGLYTQAEVLFKDALEIDREILGEGHSDYSISLSNLASLYQDQGKYAQAEILFQKALELDKEILGKNHSGYLASLNNLADLYRVQGKYKEAEVLLEKAVKICEVVLGEEHHDYAKYLHNLALLYDYQCNYNKAEFLYKKVLEIKKELLGTHNNSFIISLQNLAGIYRKQQKYELAKPLYKETLEIRKEILGKKHPHYAISLNNLGGLYLEQDQYGQAETLFQEASEIFKEMLGEKHPEYAITLNNLGGVHRKQGKYEQAEYLYKLVLAIYKEVLGESHPNYATTLSSLGILYYELKKYQEAKDLVIQAYQIRLKVFGKEHPQVKRSKRWLEKIDKEL